MFWQVELDHDFQESSFCQTFRRLFFTYPALTGNEPHYTVMHPNMWRAILCSWTGLATSVDNSVDHISVYGMEVLLDRLCLEDIIVMGLSFDTPDLERVFRVEQQVESKEIYTWVKTYQKQDSRSYRVRLDGALNNTRYGSFWRPGMSLGHMSKLWMLLNSNRLLFNSPAALRSLVDILEKSGLLFDAPNRILLTS